MISVIISTFNRRVSLEKAIKSVFKQSFTDYEIIIVDDCSIDKTESFVKNLQNQYKDKKIVYLKTEKNFGHDSLPKNIGIKASKGELICFLDDDDVYMTDTLKIRYNYLKQSGASIVYTDYFNREKNGKLTPGWSVDFNPTILKQMNYITNDGILIKKEWLLKVGGFDETIPKFKDWNLFIRLAKVGASFLHVSIPCLIVKQEEDSISHKYKVDYDSQGRYLPTFFSPENCSIYSTKTILGEEKPLKVAIFTLTKDRLEYTQRTFKGLRTTAGYPFDHFVIDQGSKDGTVKWLKNYKAKHIQFNQKNEGIGKGWNDAIKKIKEIGGYDIVIKLDNDTEFITQDWLKEMIELFRRNKKIILSPAVEGLENAPGGVLRENSGNSSYVLLNDRVLGNVPYLGGICLAIPIELYDNFKFEEASFYTGGKDVEICLYGRRNGYGIYYCEELRIKHMDTTTGQQEKYPDYFELREKELTQKFEGKKDTEKNLKISAELV